MSPKVVFQPLKITHEDGNNQILMCQMVTKMANNFAVMEDDLCDIRNSFSTCIDGIKNANVVLSAMHEPSV